MHVLYDHAIFVRQAYGGVSRYFAELIPRVADAPDADVSLFMGLHVNEYGLRRQRGRMARFFGVKRPIKRRTYRVTKPINDWLFGRFAGRTSADVYHATSYRRLLPDFRGARVVTCHDLIAEKLTQYFPTPDDFNVGKRDSLASADAVICISENTRRDAIELLGVPERKTSVIYHANSIRCPAGAAPPIEWPYLLFVGMRGSYKNFGVVLEAYAGCPELRDAFHLLCFGGGPLTPAEHQAAEKLGVLEKLHVTAGPDERLATAYAHAAAFVYPSLYEGFGIPLLEAMFYGCPVVCSRASCFPEVGGDAAIYFDPASPDDLREKLGLVIRDRATRDRLAQAGRERERLFSWDQAARETLGVYRALTGR